MRRFFELFEHVLLLATFASIVLGVYAFWIDYEDRKQARRVNAKTLEAYEEQSKVNAATLREIEDARKERQAEAITRAWSLITTPATGNSGKGPALEYLNDQGIPLRGINLSCERMGGGWDAEKLTCETPTYLRGVELQKADLTGARLQGAGLWEAQLQGADLRYAQLQGAKLILAQLQGDLMGAQLQGAELYGAELQGAFLMGAQLRGADLSSAQLKGAELYGAELQGADLRGAQLKGAYLRGAQFGGANLSRANFTDAEYLDRAHFHDPDTSLFAWAWADKPPIGLPEGVEIELCVYDGIIHRRSKRPTPCIPPDPAK